MDVSIIIVSFNTRAKTIRCIESIYKYTKEIFFEIIVSDNASSDGSSEAISEKFPDVILVKNKKNLGFGRANNIALKYAKGKYIFYLNSDTYLKNNAVKILFEFWETAYNGEKIGALGTYLRNPYGGYVHSGASFPSYKDFCISQVRSNIIYNIKLLIKRLHLDDLYMEKAKKIKKKRESFQIEKLNKNVDYITGADLFVRNDNKAVFNEQYFMYCEETELELRLKEKGLQRILIKGPIIVHDQDGNKGFSVYRPTDYYREISAIQYSKTNLKTRGLILKFLYNIGKFNPEVKKVRESIMNKGSIE